MASPAAPRKPQEDAGAAAGVSHAVTPTSGAEGAAAAAAGTAVARGLRFERRVIAIGLFLHCATQIVSLLEWRSLPASERGQRVASLAFAAALPCVTCLRAYPAWRHRILFVWRIGFFCFPLLRQPRGIQLALDTEPGAGVLGALRDWAKVAWGCRLLAVAMAPFVMPLPLAPHLAAQLFAVAAVGANPTLCAAPLLAHPTSAARIASLHHLMALVASPSVGQAAGVLLGDASAAQQCGAFLAFTRLLLGLVLPTLLVAKVELLAAVGPASRKPPSPPERLVRLLAGPPWVTAAPPTPGEAAPDADATQPGLSLCDVPRPLLLWLLLCWVWVASVAM